MRRKQIVWISVVTAVVFLFVEANHSWAKPPASPLGIFEDHGDVGTVLHPGSVEYDASTQTYTLTGSGENMWFAADAFQFVWKKLSGDVSLTADISFPTTTGNPHKKAVLMLRQSLDADSVYADIALHGSGMTALQYRDEKGALTQEIQSNLSAPQTAAYRKAGRLRLHGPGCCRTASPRSRAAGCECLCRETSTLASAFALTIRTSSRRPYFPKSSWPRRHPPRPSPRCTARWKQSRSLPATGEWSYIAPEHFEAPNWSRDGSFLSSIAAAISCALPVTGGKTETHRHWFRHRCNNDHGISPDGTQLAISDQSQDDHHSLVYIVPIGGGTPRRITKNSPSYWHGWSPDGKTLAFVGQRNDEFDIYTIPVDGGEETRLTTAKGLDDGPEYSPDGNFIYFNSVRTGTMQIWRMKRRQRAGAGHLGRVQQLVSAHLARRKVDGFSFVRQECEGTSREQGCDAAR